jgi:hypothetical protein
MPDSLVIDHLFECLGGPGGVQSDIPALMNAAGVGATFQLLAPSSSGGTAYQSQIAWDLGTPQPTTDQVQSLLLDGERPFGLRASNRTITLPLKITAPDQVTLSAAKELLMQAVDAQSWELIWTPQSTGLTMVFDCFRALPTVYSYGFLPGQPSPIAVITLSFQALPYGRNPVDALTQVAFASPIIGGIAAPPAPVVLDSFSSVSGTNWSQSSSQFVVGPHSARFTPPGALYYSPSYSKSGLGSLNITGLPVLSVWFGQSFDTVHRTPYPKLVSNVTLRWTLTDNASHTLSFHRTMRKVPWSNKAATPKWTRITTPIPQGSATFNYSAITAYSVAMTNYTSRTAANGKSAFAWLNAWLDAVTANPPSLATQASQRGVIYNIMGATGTARTPISTQFQLPQTGNVSLELAGSSGVWWPPVGVTSVQAECVGGGGAGGARTTSGQAGGGGGGEYAAEPALSVVEGTPVPWVIGKGGQSGASQQVLTFSNPGSGSWMCPTGVTTIKAECWGGGARGGIAAGGGGGGEYAAEATLAVTAGKTYKFFVGGGGSLVTFDTSGAIKGNGAASTFTGDSVTVTAHGGLTATTGGSTGGTGGTGSANTTHFNGGAGGTSPTYGGGGGGGSGGSASGGNTGGNGTGSFTGGTGAAAVTGGGAGGAGASSPGFAGNGVVPGGGGGGGCYIANPYSQNPGGTGANGQVQLTYTVAAGAPVNGASTTFGSAVSTGGVIVTAHGGSSVASNTTTGGAGGTGSANTTHNNGGTGGLGGTNGGGGGGSGGSGSAGNTGTAGASGGGGAAAVAGGGKGSAGGAAGAHAGDNAPAPGGGAGGASTTGTTEAGGTGGNGNIRLTWAPPLAPFGTLIAHRPGPGSPDTLNPCVPVANTADLPTGIEYQVPSLTAGVNALFGGTYCLSTDTEILTANGWRLPAQLSGNEIVLTLNMSTGLSEWQPLRAVHTFPAREREMLALETATHSSLSTLDHRWAVKNPYGKYGKDRRLAVQRSSELNCKSGIIRRAICANPPAEAKYSDALVELVAWYTTEGHRRRKGEDLTDSIIISQSQKVNKPYVERIRAAMTALYGPPVGKLTRYGRGNTKVTWEQVCEMRERRAAGESLKLLAQCYGLSVSRTGAICCNGAWLEEKLRPEAGPEWREDYRRADHDMTRFRLNRAASQVITEHAPGFDRVVRPEFITSLTRAQLSLFLETCIAADGWTHGRGATRYIGQKVPDRLDAMEIAAILLGFSTNRSVNAQGITDLSLGTTDVCHPVPRRSSREIVTCTIPVWCPETPNGTWFARRNGKAYFTGNTVILTAYNWDSPSASRAITVQVNQYEYANGPSYPLTLVRTVTPSTDITNGIVIMGEMTLPVKDVDPSSTSAFFTVSINDTDAEDQFLDVLFLDTQGSTVIVNIPPGNTYANLFIDEPDAERDLGRILGSDLDRSQAVSVLGNSIVSGSPFYIVPGDNLFLAYMIEGAPNLSVNFLCRWYLERQV